MFLVAVSKSFIQRVEDVMNVKWALGLGSHFLLSFLEKSFTVFCESLLMLVTDLTIAIIIPNQKEFFFCAGFTQLNIALTHSAIMLLLNSAFSSHPP